ncbi:hypothetical protein MSG28_004341 [Choristoneura fumiferana]|uniref:Uncharacterized protein n=1 Tax=Choristoneura fumiferana TaxID=7141 RepID=A0ACC0KIC3_CHOFU|nr:hypothetical protein MSG28_004341 [Choristoneura fumiferana]
MRAVLLLFTSLAAASASDRIFGGSLTTVEQYPQAAAVLSTSDLVVFYQHCGGTILNAVAILTAVHCNGRIEAGRLRVRVGSSFASNGGSVLFVQRIINHPNYNANTRDHNIAIIRLQSSITFSDVAQRGAIAGPSYNVADNRPVFAIGWGLNQFGERPDQLHHVQINTVNHQRCQQIFGTNSITDNMLCAHTEQRGLGGCTGDDGGPLLHNNVVIGVHSFHVGCSLTDRPGVYTRVSRYTDWILANARS